MKKKLVCTIEARMTSSRLPGKVMLSALGRPLLSHLIDRLRCVATFDELVLATTVNKHDDVLADFARQMNIHCFRGSENNVLERVISAADSVNADIIVEITADCPLIDPEIIEQVIRLYKNNDCDYASNVIQRSYPDGMDVQVFSLDCLKRSAQLTSHPSDQEHVTRHIRLNPQLFKQLHLVAGPLEHWPELGLVLDEPKDYELIKNILNYFGERTKHVSCREIIHLLKSIHPEWLLINQTVQRKEFS